MQLHPYLFFINGQCAEAMEFYKGIFGGELQMMPNADGKGIMHAYLKGGAIELMASDGTRTEPYETSYITLSISGSDGEAIKAAFAKLGEGGKVIDELRVEVWGGTFGMVTDKFGIDWLVNISVA